jgi:hypothetical protein
MFTCGRATLNPRGHSASPLMRSAAAAAATCASAPLAPCVQTLQQVKSAITDALDECLLTDDEWAVYQESRGEQAALDRAFPNFIAVRYVM